jgi:hypothetical protein
MVFCLNLINSKEKGDITKSMKKIIMSLLTVISIGTLAIIFYKYIKNDIEDTTTLDFD